MPKCGHLCVALHVRSFIQAWPLAFLHPQTEKRMEALGLKLTLDLSTCCAMAWLRWTWLPIGALMQRRHPDINLTTELSPSTGNERRYVARILTWSHFCTIESRCKAIRFCPGSYVSGWCGFGANVRLLTQHMGWSWIPNFQLPLESSAMTRKQAVIVRNGFDAVETKMNNVLV